MGYITLGIITIFLAIIGFVEVLKQLVFRIYKRQSENALMLIIPELPDCDNPEYFLRSYAESTKWMGSLRPRKIICISDNITAEGKKIASLACYEYDFIELMTADELNNILKQNIGKKDC